MSKEQNKSGHLIDEATKTPRTQAAIKTYGDYIRSEDAVSIEFAEQLETELAEARAEIENKQYSITCDAERIQLLCETVEEQRAEIERKDELIEQMRDALNVLVASATPSGPLWHGSAEMQIARAALSAAERGEG